MYKRDQTEGEELANFLSHGFGFLLVTFIGLPVLVLAARREHHPWQLIGGLVFGCSMMLVYAVSTAYHLLPRGRAKRWCQLFDHAAIFVLIAGTYTPFALGPLRGPWGWSVLAVAWTLAGLGVVLKLRHGISHEYLSTLLYLLMGWMSLAVLQPLVTQIGVVGFLWLLAGGLSYSFGVVFFLWERLRFSHVYWHGFVLAGSLCHFIAVARYT